MKVAAQVKNRIHMFKQDTHMCPCGTKITINQLHTAKAPKGWLK